MKRKASAPIERSDKAVKRVASSPVSEYQVLLYMFREARGAMRRARSATKIQALFRGYIFRLRLAQRADSLLRAKARFFSSINSLSSSVDFPEMKQEWQWLNEAITLYIYTYLYTSL